MQKENIREMVAQKLMDTEEVCEYLHISRQYLHTLMKQGKIIPIKKGKSSPVFWFPDILEYESSKHSELLDEIIRNPEPTSQNALKFLQDMNLQPNEIESITIYGDHRESVADGYYKVTLNDSVTNLNFVKGYSCVIKRVNAPTICIDGFNCGYCGEGPNVTCYYLSQLGIKSEEELEEIIYRNRFVRLIAYDSDKWEIITRKASYFEELDSILNGWHYLCEREGNLILFPFIEARNQENDVTMTPQYIQKLMEFLPDITSAESFSNKACIENNYFIQQFSHLYLYPIVLKNPYRKEIWIPASEQSTVNARRLKVKSLFESIGIEWSQESDAEKSPILNRIINFFIPS